jgi:ribosomal protein S18 acetylase RimI-like enzyme
MYIVGLESVSGSLKIPMLAVKKEFRKQGIGTALLNKFLDEAAEKREKI